MHIILVSDRLATARTITLTKRHLALIAAALFAAIIGLSSVFSYLTVRHAAEIRMPFLENLLRTVNAEQAQRSREFVQENLNAMAVKLGQMQAQLMRIDSMGERLAALAGVKPADVRPPEPKAGQDGRGGPLIQPTVLTAEELGRALDDLSHRVEAKSDALAALESQLLGERIKKSFLPTSLPVEAQWNASGYGWRTDPFTGQVAMHEGVDFPADIGTPIKAAAAGIVVSVTQHPEYGNLVEIDHGNGLTTRYAHTSKVLTKVGAFVKRGQVVAEVGTTGRSTGPHLHFEVRVNGVAHNPNEFLRLAQANSTLARR